MSLITHYYTWFRPRLRIDVAGRMARLAPVAGAFSAVLWSLVAASPGFASDRAIELDEVTVVSSGTSVAHSPTEAAIRSDLIGPDLILSSGARNLAAALEYLPGLRAESSCQNCGATEIRMLGLGPGYSQLLFDGHPLFCGLASVYGLEQIPAASIGRVEVTRGGASSLHGPAAVAGVINIIPNEPAFSKQRYDVAVESVAGEAFTSAAFLKDRASDSGHAALSLHGQFSDDAAVDLDGDGFSELAGKQFRSVGANGWLYPGESGKLRANYSYTWEKRRGGNAFDRAPHEAQIAEQIEHAWHRGGLAWESGNASEIAYGLSGSFSRINRASYYGGVGSVAMLGQPNYDASVYQEELERSRLLYGRTATTRYYLDSFFSSLLSQHHLSWGFQYLLDEVFDEKRDELDRPLRTDGTLAEYHGQDPVIDSGYSNLGVFLQDEWRPTPTTTVLAGLRGDRHSELDLWIISPRLALRHTASADWTWRASVANGFRAPEMFDEDFHIEIFDDPIRTRNADDLVAERSTSWTAGFVWTPSFLENRLRVDLEAYRTDIRDTFNVADIVYVDAQGNPYKKRVNASSSTVQGTQIDCVYRISESWSLEAGVVRVDSRFDQEQEILPGLYEARYPETPKWSGVARLKYENPRVANLLLGLNYTGPMIAVRETEGTLNRATPEFYVVDLTVTRHFHWTANGRQLHIDTMVGVKNLFDERQTDLSRGPDRDPTYVYGPRFPRSFVFRVGTSW